MDSGRHALQVARRTRELGPGIGRRLRQARDRAGLSQEALSKLAHTSPTTIVTIEAGGGGNSGVGLLVDLSRALKVRPCWLILGEGEQEAREPEEATTDEAPSEKQNPPRRKSVERS